MNIQVRRKDKEGRVFTNDNYSSEIDSIHFHEYYTEVIVKWRDSNHDLILQSLICQKQDNDLDDYELQDNEEFGEIL